MFTWICPKCGKEVPPSYAECPNCAVGQEPAGTAAEPVSPQPPVAGPPVASAVPAAVPPAAAPAAAHRPGGVSVPGWLLSMMIAAVLIIVGVIFILLKDSGRPAVAPPATALETPVAPAAVSDTDPAFRNVELTGLRITEDAKQKPFVQAVVVNHSAADLGELPVKVNLKAVARQSQELVGTFAFKVSLGPYESKEIKAPLSTRLRVYELPDWQFLRAEATK
jgi:hypothetical protein